MLMMMILAKRVEASLFTFNTAFNLFLLFDSEMTWWQICSKSITEFNSFSLYII